MESPQRINKGAMRRANIQSYFEFTNCWWMEESVPSLSRMSQMVLENDGGGNFENGALYFLFLTA